MRGGSVPPLDLESCRPAGVLGALVNREHTARSNRVAF